MTGTPERTGAAAAVRLRQCYARSRGKAMDRRGEMVQVHFAVRRLGHHLIRTVLPGASGHIGEAAYIRGDLLGDRRRTLTVMISLRTAPESRTQV